MVRGRFLYGLLGLLVFLPPLRAAEHRDAVGQAIDRGVAALKAMQHADGNFGSREVGATALAGLTLLECGVSAKDPSVQRAADAFRAASIELTHTYSIALALMFFDRLDDPRDEPLIQSLGVRLLAGQNTAGGWSYQCPRLDGSEVRRLTTLVKQRHEMVGSREPPRLPPEQRRDPRNLPREIREQLEALERQGPKAHAGITNFLGLGDNSNTQFATLGLWAARRHGLPVDRALARLDARYRQSQNGDGGWGYIPEARRGGILGSTGAMTCAGLLGLAVRHGHEATLRTDPRAKPAQARTPHDLAKDPAVRAGLLALGTTIGQPLGKGKGPIVARGPALRKGYYFLWSVERVAVAYGLATIANKDWYAWGAEALLASQGPDGSWQGEYGGDVDTCFALLFLRRVNLTPDLTVALKGMVKDPGTVTLRTGGVGGEALLNKGLTAGLAYREPPVARPEAEAVRLSNQMVQAPAEQQDRLLQQLREGKGALYTQALATAIPRLDETGRKKARTVLVERLTRMTAATLRDKLQDEDVEVRRGAALACALKAEKGHVPELIGLLEDPEILVARAARAALKSLTGEDFGPAADAGRVERARAAAEWKAWWSRQDRN